MIVGIVALLTALFFGGAQEYFFIEKLEKGVKQFVLDKDRSKEILVDLKDTKSIVKAFNKERKGQFSEFLSMNLDQDISRDELDNFFEYRVEERLALQEKMIDKRLLVVSKIEDAEWEKIINLSDASMEKKMAKAVKKGNNDPFESVLKTINSTISDQGNKAQAISVVQNFKERYVKLLDEINSFNSLENDLLNNKNSTAIEFNALANDMNQLRKTAYQSFVDLHFDMKQITHENEWIKVMKSMNKVIK